MPRDDDLEPRHVLDRELVQQTKQLAHRVHVGIGFAREIIRYPAFVLSKGVQRGGVSDGEFLMQIRDGSLRQKMCVGPPERLHFKGHRLALVLRKASRC